MLLKLIKGAKFVRGAELLTDTNSLKVDFGYGSKTVTLIYNLGRKGFIIQNPKGYGSTSPMKYSQDLDDYRRIIRSCYRMSRAD